MLTPLLLPLMFIAPTAEEPTPIDSYFVETFIDQGGGETLCTAYGTLMDVYQTNGMTDPVFIDVADAFIIIQIEGDSMRLLPAARDTLTLWLHTTCG